MDTVISLITGWKDLITDVFGSYPLAGAIVTLVAAGIFYLLHTEYRKGKTASNAFWVFFGWAITVPIVGFLLDIASEIYGAIKKVLGFLWSALSSLYGIYVKHPLFVLFLLVVAVAAYVVWAWFRPKLIPGKPLRVIILCVVIIVLAHIVSPLLDLFVGQQKPSQQQQLISPAASQSSVSSSVVNMLDPESISSASSLLLTSSSSSSEPKTSASSSSAYQATHSN